MTKNIFVFALNQGKLKHERHSLRKLKVEGYCKFILNTKFDYDRTVLLVNLLEIIDLITGKQVKFIHYARTCSAYG